MLNEEQKKDILSCGRSWTRLLYFNVLTSNITYFISCNDLILQLKIAHLDKRLKKILKFFANYKVLIIDEVGFLPLDIESSNLFFS
ncbi:ATP-binding protein [Mycoplasmatota bacterium]|nr:ATP-binding protein [Mycoplasmatota bacterium]